MKMTNEALRLAVEHTAQVTGFSPRLVEKDYYCSLFLHHLYSDETLRQHLIFKGGTLLAKGFLGFYRLSEDLDFAVSNEFCDSRTERRRVAEIIKNSIEVLLPALGFREVSALRGFNESRQYNGVFGYTSVTGVPDTIKFEVGFRGDLMLPTIDTSLSTLLVDPFSKDQAIAPIMSKALSQSEAYAEKVRAALSRRMPAIRDLFDLTEISKSGFDLCNTEFTALIARKIAADDSAKCDATLAKKSLLKNAVDTDLTPVLKNGQVFFFEEAWKLMEIIAYNLSNHQTG